MLDAVFVDTGFIVALLEPGDRHALAARRRQKEVRSHHTPLVTTSLVLVELGDRFARPDLWRMLQATVTAMRASKRVEVVDVDASVIERATALKNARGDKNWGITDCTSFVIMQEHGITRALSCDRHFEQAGFKALLIEQ